MSLNWNLSKIENNDEVCWIKRDPLPSEGDVSDKVDENGQITSMNPVTNMLIWTTISVKMGEITEKNAAEFYARMAFANTILGGAPLFRTNEDGEREDVYITPEDVQAHIGLTCNVTTESRAKFLGSFKQDLERYEWDYRSKTKDKETV